MTKAKQKYLDDVIRESKTLISLHAHLQEAWNEIENKNDYIAILEKEFRDLGGAI